jgi:hypothetical protein
MDVEIYRDALLRKQSELLGGTAAKPLQWTMENNSGRQGDMADQASRPTPRFCRRSTTHCTGSRLAPTASAATAAARWRKRG